MAYARSGDHTSYSKRVAMTTAILLVYLIAVGGRSFNLLRLTSKAVRR